MTDPDPGADPGHPDDEAARRLLIECELLADQAELNTRREVLHRALREVVTAVGGLDAPRARAVWQAVGETAERYPVDEAVVAALAALADVIPAVQFEHHGAERMAELGAWLCD